MKPLVDLVFHPLAIPILFQSKMEPRWTAVEIVDDPESWRPGLVGLYLILLVLKRTNQLVFF